MEAREGDENDDKEQGQSCRRIRAHNYVSVCALYFTQ